VVSAFCQIRLRGSLESVDITLAREGLAQLEFGIMEEDAELAQLRAKRMSELQRQHGGVREMFTWILLFTDFLMTGAVSSLDRLDRCRQRRPPHRKRTRRRRSRSRLERRPRPSVWTHGSFFPYIFQENGGNASIYAGTASDKRRTGAM
jgi:hypothetical protein